MKLKVLRARLDERVRGVWEIDLDALLMRIPRDPFGIYQ